MNEIIASASQCSYCHVLLSLVKLSDNKLYYYHGESQCRCPNGDKFFLPISIATIPVIEETVEP